MKLLKNKYHSVDFKQPGELNWVLTAIKMKSDKVKTVIFNLKIEEKVAQ